MASTSAHTCSPTNILWREFDVDEMQDVLVVCFSYGDLGRTPYLVMTLLVSLASHSPRYIPNFPNPHICFGGFIS